MCDFHDMQYFYDSSKYWDNEERELASGNNDRAKAMKGILMFYVCV